MLLEEELGCSLLKRDTRHMALTEAGELLYTKAREVLRQCGDIKREVADISSGRGGTAHIGVVSSISSRLLPELVMRFHSLYPNVHLEFKERDSYELSDLMGRIFAGKIQDGKTVSVWRRVPRKVTREWPSTVSSWKEWRSSS